MKRIRIELPHGITALVPLPKGWERVTKGRTISEDKAFDYDTASDFPYSDVIPERLVSDYYAVIRRKK